MTKPVHSMYARWLVCLWLLLINAAWAQNSLNFIFPAAGQIVGGDHILLMATVNGTFDPSEQRLVVFETSSDGETFIPLLQAVSPDTGPSTYTSALDSSNFPLGTLYLRARFANENTGPSIAVNVRRPPIPSCNVARLSSLGVSFDCSASSDSNGGIASYYIDFGDGSNATSSTPRINHVYPRFGKYSWSITTTDAVGLSATVYKNLTFLQMVPVVDDRAECGCKKMTLKTTGNSTLIDPRRPKQGGGFNVAPLGADPAFVSMNFEISAELRGKTDKEKGDPEKCTEGQEVKGTFTTSPPNVPAIQDHKMACSKGRPLAICRVNADCNTLGKCAGGLFDKQGCATPQEIVACQLGGGACQINNDGVCTSYPFAGATRGNDDYTAPSPKDGGMKVHSPAGNPIWLDFVGASSTPHQQLPVDFKAESDFIAFVNGNKQCTCHFKLTIDWDGKNQKYRAATGIQLLQGETSNCEVAK